MIEIVYLYVGHLDFKKLFCHGPFDQSEGHIQKSQHRSSGFPFLNPFLHHFDVLKSLSCPIVLEIFNTLHKDTNQSRHASLS